MALRQAWSNLLARSGWVKGLNGARRWLSIHEYQGAEMMRSAGITVPRSEVFASAKEAKEAANRVGGGDEVVLKAQVLAGGRGLGSFPATGLSGGVHVVKPGEAEAVAEKMLGHSLVTKQTGAEGKPVSKVMVAEKIRVAREMYLAIAVDRAAAAPIIIGSAEGGTSIEELAERAPEKIVRMHVDYDKGLSDEEAREVASRLQAKDQADAAEQVKRMYELFCKRDLTLLEVNPLVETHEGRLLAADAKLNFDDNAEFRQEEAFALRDTTQEDPREVAAREYELNYVGLDGSIGCMVNGAGLAMATMDIIKLHGGQPANFLDVGGSASEDQIVQAFNLLSGDKTVKAILVNIFGGIMRCDVIASGIVKSAERAGLSVPLVVRLEGTNVQEGKRILSASTLNITPADDLDDAAQKVVKATPSSS